MEAQQTAEATAATVAPATNEKDIMTCSSARCYAACPKLFYWRYERELVRKEEREALSFGRAMHEALAVLHTAPLPDALCKLSNVMPVADTSTTQVTAYRKARAMLRAYADHYDHFHWEVKPEQEFSGRLVNPATGRSSRTFVARGKIDGIVADPGQLWVMEHKTSSKITGSYIDQIAMDLQVLWYVWAARNILSLPVAGVIYNVLEKPGIRLRQKETPEEFEDRCVEYIGENHGLHRECNPVTDDMANEAAAQVWAIGQAINAARRTGVWYKNTRHCFHYHSPCDYHLLCTHLGDHTNLIDYAYRSRPAHCELGTDDDNELSF